MILEFEKRIVDFLTSIEFPFSNDKILLAVSGGADSTALLHVFSVLKLQNLFTSDLYCAHINHQLRNDADSDEEFVMSQAEKLNVPITTRRIDVRGFARDNKLSIETAARQLRIEKLVENAKANKCNWIVTGHQKNDNAETIIHRLLRGTGFRGLTGIRPVRNFDENIVFARPFLCVTRDEIIQYLQQKNLKWREDYTNKDYSYTRNHIRHRIIPALQEDCNGSLIELLSKLSISANRFYKSVCVQADNLWQKAAKCGDEKVTLDLRFFSEQFPPVKLELIRRSLSHIGCGEAQLTSSHYERILNLTKQNSSRKVIQLPDGFIIRKEDENIVIRRAGLAPPISSRSGFIDGGVEPHPTVLKIPGLTTFNEFEIQASILEKEQVDFKKFLNFKTSSIEWFDLDKIKPSLTVRFRKKGDRFVPLGQKIEKKIGKFLTAQHVPEEIRRSTLIIADTEKIIWLYPLRISEQTKVTPQTQKILQMQIDKQRFYKKCRE
jgi:tRNA(Ile)-lysidine synthase